MTHSLRTPIVLCVATLLASSAALAQNYATSVDVVTLNVRVTRPGGEYVGDLQQSAFTVFEDGAPQAVTFFASQDTPATVGVLVDSSISMHALRDTLVDGASAFARSANPGDEMFAIAFNEMPLPVLSPRAPFTSDANILRDALNAGIRPRGRTALYDAIGAGLRYADRGALSRRALVVISDGGDNASTSTLEQIVADTRASNVVLYAVALVDPLNSDARPAVLRQFAQQTGGESFTARNSDDIRTTLERISRDIRHTYTLGYSPAGSPDGAFHTIRVAVVPPARQRVVVSTRQGYLRRAIEQVPAPDAREPGGEPNDGKASAGEPNGGRHAE